MPVQPKATKAGTSAVADSTLAYAWALELAVETGRSVASAAELFSLSSAARRAREQAASLDIGR